MTTSQNVFQVEIRTRDVTKGAAFYGAVFDWKIYPSGPAYALVDSGVMPVIGILQDPRLPLGICNNVLVEDCQKAGERAVELGGIICVSRSEVPNSGLFVGTLDPWGNELFFWQPYASGRPNLKGSGENPFALLEIATPDLPAAIKYYTELVGWSFRSIVFADGYAMSEGCGLKRGVGLVGGSVRTAETLNYVEVASLEETMNKVRQAGGRIFAEPADFPGDGRYFIFQDLDGNKMGAIEKRPT